MPLVAALLSYLAFCLGLPFWLLHPKLRAGHAARLGIYRRALPPKRQQRLWVHGASAGDVLALLPTVRALRLLRPNVEVVASTITNSGHAMAIKHLSLFAAVVYAPYDLPGAVRRALRALQPDVLILEYTELWPNLIHAAAAQGVPLVLHNGRFSLARLHRYRWLFALVGNLLRPLHCLLLRDAQEAERALLLGARPEQLAITGNTKFDSVSQAPNAAKVENLRRWVASNHAQELLWVAGSTHEGEEELLLDALLDLRREFTALKLLLAPRYTERCDKVVALCKKRQLRVSMRQPVSADVRGIADVLVLNTIGELGACYPLASLVFVGGSFVPRGGQNILEPAASGKPVLFGPHMENFADSVQVLLGRGGIQVASGPQLVRVMRDLLRRSVYRTELGSTAKAQVRAISGAAARNAQHLAQVLEAR
jgi:3-deoxy-D-manno-octulosonic-acid transferase